MIDIQKYIIKTMKKVIFSNSEDENKAARQVLAEIKTKYIDIKGEITSEIQYKILKKMREERAASIDTYKGANRMDLALKEAIEKDVIEALLKEVENDLPKMMTEDEIKAKIEETIKGIEKPNIGIIMKAFKDIKNVDKAVVSKLAKEYCK